MAIRTARCKAKEPFGTENPVGRRKIGSESLSAPGPARDD